jgi:hypothetical protein
LILPILRNQLTAEQEKAPGLIERRGNSFYQSVATPMIDFQNPVFFF